jgi:hypothetical protein
MTDENSEASIGKHDMLYEMNYLNKLNVVHKCVLLLFMRDRNRYDKCQLK